MSLIDSLNETRGHKNNGNDPDDDMLGWDLTETDIAHILPTTDLVVRRNALSLSENDTPYNVYTKVPKVLPSSILDECSEGVGEYLLYRYVCRGRLFDMTEIDIPNVDQMHGTPDLKDGSFRQFLTDKEFWFDNYEGWFPSGDGPKADPEELRLLAEKLKQNA